MPAVSKNAFVNYDVASGFDVVSKILLKSSQLMMSIVFVKS